MADLGQWVKFFLQHGDKLIRVGAWFRDLAPRIRDWLNGKKVTIIGPTAAGKNSFYYRLQGKQILTQHVTTKMPKNVPRFEITHVLPNGKTFQITVKRSSNVGGEKEQRERFWFDACNDSDIIFYIFSVQDLRGKTFLPGKRIHEDLEWLAENIGHLKSSPRIHFLINKIDLELPNVNEANYEEYVAALKPAVAEFEGFARIALGQYKTRMTGCSATSMLNNRIFNKSLVITLEAVYETVHRNK